MCMYVYVHPLAAPLAAAALTGKEMSGTKTVVTAMIMTPIQSHPSATVIDPLVKKIACVIAAPALPPAPTKPEATPRPRRVMKGTTPKEAPSAICTKSEKTITTTIVPASDSRTK